MFAQLLYERTVSILSNPPRMMVSEWAEKFRWLSREYSARFGKFRLSSVPYAKAPMDDVHDEKVRCIVLKWARQLTKTTILENIIGYFIDSDPASILLVLPTVEDVRKFSTERLANTIRDTPALRDKVYEARSRDANNTIQTKMFPGGSLAMVGANSPSGLSGRSIRVALFDEVDKYPISAGVEGDPINVGLKTTETFSNSVVLITGTTTVKGASRIDLEYEETDKRKLFAACPFCGEWQTLEWANVIFKDGPKTAHIECGSEECGRPWSDKQRIAAIRAGQWRPTAKFNGKRGYFLSGIYSLFPPKRGFKSRLHQAAEEFLEAKAAMKRGNKEKMKVFINCFLNEEWEEEGEKINPVTVSGRCEAYTPQTLPDKVLIVVGGADVQADRVELEWQGIGLDEESWGIESVVVHGDIEKPDTWRRLSMELMRRFKRIDGVELTPAALSIDTHYRPKVVREWCRSHGTSVLVYPVLGASSEQQVLIVSRFNKQFGMRIWTIATNMAKDTIFARLNMVPDESGGGPRYLHFPRGCGYTDEWFAQLTSEKVVTRYRNGYPYRIYVKDENARNEALDMRVYAINTLEVLRPNLPEIKKLLELKREQKPTPGNPQSQPPPRRISLGGGGFVGGSWSGVGGGWKI